MQKLLLTFCCAIIFASVHAQSQNDEKESIKPFHVVLKYTPLGTNTVFGDIIIPSYDFGAGVTIAQRVRLELIGSFQNDVRSADSFSIPGQNINVRTVANSLIGLGVAGSYVKNYGRFNYLVGPRFYSVSNKRKTTEIAGTQQEVNSSKIINFHLGVGGGAEYMLASRLSIGVEGSALFYTTKFESDTPTNFNQDSVGSFISMSVLSRLYF